MKKLFFLLLLPFIFSCSSAIEKEEIALIGETFAGHNYAAVLRQYVEINPSHHLQLPIEIHKMVGISSFKTGDTEAAERRLINYLAVNEQDGEVYFYLALIKASRGEEYCQHMKAAIERGFEPDKLQMFEMNLPPCQETTSK